MSWIKDNKFIAALGGGTLLGVILLYFVGAQGSKRYDQAKEEFEGAYSEASGYEKLALYPKSDNLNAKKKALDDYRKSVESIQNAFEPFRPKEIVNSSPQDFTNKLLEATNETRKAFEDAGTIVPEAYFTGFENYKTVLANGNTTGILGYQLSAIKNLMLELAKAKPMELKNLHRPALPEESGQTFTPAPAAVSRAFPLEITFVGTENSAREFLSSLAKADNKYAVIRSIRISNEKKTPPLSTDAKFESASAAAAAPEATGGAIGFSFPGDEAPATPAGGDAAPEAAPTAATSGRILAQVLGNEPVQVFVRLDVLQFLPVKALPN